MKRLLGVLILAAAAVPSIAEPVSFLLKPEHGEIAGVFGETIGWGYTLFNPDPAAWFLPTGLSADSFTRSTAIVLFTFPMLPPSSGVEIPFDWATFSGLYAISWNLDAPARTVESGTFKLSGEWWSDDPFAGGEFLANADTVAAAYRAALQETSVPEPRYSAVIAFCICWLTLQRSRLAKILTLGNHEIDNLRVKSLDQLHF